MEIVRLYRKLHSLTGLDNSGDVKIEEIGIEDSLHNSGNDNDWIEIVLGVITVDPVEDVKSAVRAKSKQVVSSNDLSGTGGLEEEELWENSNSLQIDRESPEQLEWSVIMIDNESKNHRWNNKELNTEGVRLAHVSGTELEEHQVYSSVRGSEESNLHETVVEGDVCGEKIQVASSEHDSE